MVERLFLVELLRRMWYKRRQVIEVSKEQIDSWGYDVVLSAGGRTRYVQLKTRLSADVNERLALREQLSTATLNKIQSLFFDSPRAHLRRALTMPLVQLKRPQFETIVRAVLRHPDSMLHRNGLFLEALMDDSGKAKTQLEKLARIKLDWVLADRIHELDVVLKNWTRPSVRLCAALVHSWRKPTRRSSRLACRVPNHNWWRSMPPRFSEGQHNNARPEEAPRSTRAPFEPCLDEDDVAEGPATVQCPSQIRELIAQFKQRKDEVYGPDYKEANVRQDFLNPLFSALGWNVHDSREVQDERRVDVKGESKSVDYAFKVGKQVKFLLEAKRPREKLEGNATYAFQARRYGWNVGIPFVVLSDFEEFVIYDTTKRPKESDSANIELVKSFRFTDYEEEWPFLWSKFSKDAVEAGSLDAWSKERPGQKHRIKVDESLLEDIREWRIDLAKNIIAHNRLEAHQLAEVVQLLLDRVLFLRICEDRGLETPRRLASLLEGTDVYGRLKHFFERADQKYNAGLFYLKEQPDRGPADTLSPTLVIDDNALKHVVKGLYNPDRPYDFSKIPTEILGQVYEQFLGQVLRVTSSGERVKAEDKPEVKKAGGVYYTPSYIVDYIVAHTLGPLVEGKEPEEVARLKVLDPACGSGSFLLGAYQFLLDWHLKWYLAHGGVKKHKEQLIQLAKDRVVLSVEERKRILRNNVYGVDIDRQAVEVTKLSLFLKVVEETAGTALDVNQKLVEKRVLPHLDGNIKSGNSLIEPGHLTVTLFGELEAETQRRVNPFGWKGKEGWPKTFGNGGFDAVIGNPPYGYMIPELEQSLLSKHYKHQDYQKDLYLLFLERYAHLVRNGGLLGIIVSNTWLQSVNLKKIRMHLVAEYQWRQVAIPADKVFKAVVDTHVLVFERKSGGIAPDAKIAVREVSPMGSREIHALPGTSIPREGSAINVVQNQSRQALFRRIVSVSRPLKESLKIFSGINPYEVGKGTPPQPKTVLKERPFTVEGPRPDSAWSPLLRGSLIQKYELLWDDNYWIKYGKWLAAPRDPAIFSAPSKLMVRQTGDSIIATIVPAGYYALKNLHIAVPINVRSDLRFFAGILNSKLMDFIYECMNPEKGEALAEVKKAHVEELPIPTVEPSNAQQTAVCGRIVNLVDGILALNIKKNLAKTDVDRELLQRQVGAATQEVDVRVYELYGLTDAEIKLVEASFT